MAAAIELLGELRDAVEWDSRNQSRTSRVENTRRIEALWEDLVNLFAEERQHEVDRFDGWLRRVEEALDAWGEVVKLVELGVKLTDRRAHLLKLDARAVIQPHIEIVDLIANAQIDSEEEGRRIMEGRVDPEEQEYPTSGVHAHHPPRSVDPDDQ